MPRAARAVSLGRIPKWAWRILHKYVPSPAASKLDPEYVVYNSPSQQQPRRPLSYKSVVNHTAIAFLVLSEKFCDRHCIILIVVIIKYIRIIQPRAVPA